MDDPSPVGFMNVYEEGDLWMKVQGCEGCPTPCCGQCAMLFEKKCLLHLFDKGSKKPFNCVVKPSPVKHNSDCQLVFECVQGKSKGKFRWKCDPQMVFRDKGP